jgi:hypothetical protein
MWIIGKKDFFRFSKRNFSVTCLFRYFTCTNEIRFYSVIIVNEQAFRNTWERGVVVKVYPDARGHVRSADVRTANGTYKSPTVKLAVLDLVK